MSVLKFLLRVAVINGKALVIGEKSSGWKKTLYSHTALTKAIFFTDNNYT